MKGDADAFYKIKLNEYTAYGILNLNELCALLPALKKWIAHVNDHGASLEGLDDVVSKEIKRYNEQMRSRKLDMLVDDIVEQVTTNHQRRTGQTSEIGSNARNLRSRLKKLVTFFGTDILISDIDLNQAKAFIQYLFEDCELSSTSVRNIHSSTKTLFQFAIQNEYLKQNIFDRVPLPEKNDNEIGYYSLAVMENMWWYSCHKLRVAIVLLGYCGLRVCEYKRIFWEDITFHVDGGNIHINSETGKNGRKRSIPIDLVSAKQLSYLKSKVLNEEDFFNKQDHLNVSELLDSETGESSFDEFVSSITTENMDDVVIKPTRNKIFDLPEKKYSKMFNDLLQQFGGTKIHNGLRHSFGTYHYAMHGNWVQTTNMMGNSQKVLEKHYAALSNKAVAENYFNIINDLDTPITSYSDAYNIYSNDPDVMSSDSHLDLYYEPDSTGHPSHRRIHDDF
ncbi:MAG: tyrosine-type recombinase/integrase [Bacteroidota bacterium]